MIGRRFLGRLDPVDHAVAARLAQAGRAAAVVVAEVAVVAALARALVAVAAHVRVAGLRRRDGRGDGFVQAGEACDLGDLDDEDECVAGRVAAVCGDGFVRAGVAACDEDPAAPSSPRDRRADAVRNLRSAAFRGFEQPRDRPPPLR